MLIPVLTFIAVSVIIGLYAGGQIGGKVKNYFVAGNVLPFWVIAFSQTGQAIESGGTLGNASFSFSNGFWAGALLPVGVGVSLLMIGLFYAEPLNKMKLLTLPDFYFRRFGRIVEFLASVMTVFGFVILLAANIAGMGIILNFVFGINQVLTIIGIAFVVMIYTISGGLFAVTWNDILQIGIGIIGFSAAFVWLLVSSPDAALLASAIRDKFSFSPMYSMEEGALRNWGPFLALALGDIVALDFMERVFAANSPRAARIACYISGFLTIVTGVMVALIGLMCTVYFNDPAETNVILKFVTSHLPAGIAMLFVVGLLGAGISTIDGAIMASATVITRNMIQNLFPDFIPPNRLLFYSRLMALPVTAGAVIFAIWRPDPGFLLVLAFEVVFAGCLVPLTFGIYWKRGTPNAAFWSIVIPSALRIYFEFNFPEAWKGLDSLIPPVISAWLFIGISFLENPPGVPLRTLPKFERAAL